MYKICPTHIFEIYAKNATFWVSKVEFWKSLKRVHFVTYPPPPDKCFENTISGMAANFLKRSRRLFLVPLRTPYIEFHGLRIIRIVENTEMKRLGRVLSLKNDSEAGTPTRL
jgi:hypothetical protein